MQKNLLLISLLVIFLLGAYLRVYHYSDFPPRGTTMDEYAWAWQGISLIKDRVPSAWSHLSPYEHRIPRFYDGAYFPIVTPYLDHPPLFGLLVGGTSLLRGEIEFSQVTLKTIRTPMIILGLISLILVFLLAQKLYGLLVALVSAFFYASNPSIVVSSRIVESENLLIVLALLSLYFLIKYFETKKMKWRNLLILTAGMSVLVKMPGIFIGLTILTLLALKKRWEDFYWLGFVLCLSFILFLSYGLWFGGSKFVQILLTQAERMPGPATALRLLSQPALVTQGLPDGLIIWGWFSILILAFRWQKNRVVLLAPLVYLVVLLFMAPQYDPYSWYYYPFYPFLAIAGAKVLVDSLKASNFFLTTLFFLIAFLSAFYWVGIALSGSVPTFLFRVVLVFGIVPYLLSEIWTKDKKLIANLVGCCMLVIMGILNIMTILGISNQGY